MSIKDKIIQDAAGKLMGWKLPHDFYPDCYVHFDMATANANGSWPTGTNLFHVGQATDMLEYCIGASLRTALAERDALNVKAHGEIRDLNAALAERDAEIAQAEYDCEEVERKWHLATDEIERLRAAAQQALEALKFAYNDCESPFTQDEKIDPAIITLTAALESKT